MTQEQVGRINDFGFTLGNTAGNLTGVLEDKEIVEEFASRGVSVRDLYDLRGSLERVASAFYTPKSPFASLDKLRQKESGL